MSPWRIEEAEENLANLKPGHLAAVLQAGRATPERLRLMEMGFVPGAMVEVISGKISLMVRIGDHRMCLHPHYASQVAVLPLQPLQLPGQGPEIRI